MKLQLRDRPAIETRGEAGVAFSPQKVAPTPSLTSVFESLGKGLSGSVNRFELLLLFVEKLSNKDMLSIFCHFFDLSVF